MNKLDSADTQQSKQQVEGRGETNRKGNREGEADGLWLSYREYTVFLLQAIQV